MQRRMVVAKTQMDQQQQQQRIVADETKPQAAVKGGRIAPCRSDEIRLASTSSLDRDESESTMDWGGSSPPSQNESIGWRMAANFVSKFADGDRNFVSKFADGDRWRLAYEGGFRQRQVPWRACKLGE